MIIIKSLKWSNWFSYGADNYIDFEDAKLLQVMGLNGSGKTSIPLIIEETLYGKNSKGVKKQSLVNRYIDKASLSSELIFTVDSDMYKIDLSRKATLKLKLEKNGEDISSHTATATYKTIQSILGMDFKTFTQLIYQSSKSNLEFLTSTDTNRKKFLISLFNLDKYLVIHEHFKKAYTNINNESARLSGKVSTLEAWIAKSSSTDFSTKPTQNLPVLDLSISEELAQVKAKTSDIAKINSKINKNNQYIELLDSIDTKILSESISVDLDLKSVLMKKGKRVRDEKVGLEADARTINKALAHYRSLGSTCNTCKQDIDQTIVASILENKDEEIKGIQESIITRNNVITVIKADLKKIADSETKYTSKLKVESEVIRLSSLIDRELGNYTLDAAELQVSITSLTKDLKDMQDNISNISNTNARAEAHNSKIEVIKSQLAEHIAELEEVGVEAAKQHNKLTKINILKKAFGTNGLLNYKVEYLVKDLEAQINEYLGELSSGKFQLLFVLAGEKLNIEIIDEGITVSIEELSAGELARINASTLLAIRKLMAALSSTKINILFLDEVMGVLDAEGKEKLIDVLTVEKELNTLLVSHEFSHPLVPKLTVIKEDKISRIEHD